MIKLEKNITPISIQIRLILLRVSLIALSLFSICQTSTAQIIEIPEILTKGFTKISYVSSESLNNFVLPEELEKEKIKSFCNTTKDHFKRYKWNEDPCGEVKWKADLKSNLGHPLIYASFGTGKNTTLYLGGVHPDELTPVHLAFKLSRYLSKNPQIYQNKDVEIIIAPLVNPDAFFLDKPLRVNHHGVDVNRNFFTVDWYKKAINSWRQRGKARGRYFPGYIANSEIETLFQMKLIDNFTPSKIISIHAPLGFLDYDGPGDQKYKLSSKSEKLAKHLVQEISKKSQNYRVVDYSFYPGSLGNFAGNERDIPTITLELKTANPSQVEKYWNQFLPGLLTTVEHPFEKRGNKPDGNASNFSEIYKHDTIKKSL